MTNNLPFWTLQHLYVILSLADVRTISDILEINHVFSILHPEVERMEEKQTALGERVKPLIKQREILANALKNAEENKGDVSLILKNQEKNAETLHKLDKELQDIQGTTPEFEWTPDAISTIREVVPHIFNNLGVQHEQLSGYRRIKATVDIIEFFSIPVVVSL